MNLSLSGIYYQAVSASLSGKCGGAIGSKINITGNARYKCCRMAGLVAGRSVDDAFCFQCPPARSAGGSYGVLHSSMLHFPENAAGRLGVKTTLQEMPDTSAAEWQGL